MAPPKRSTLREILSPGPSLETEDDEDEDYVVDEAVEGADDDEEGDASSSEEDNEEEEGSEDAPQDSCERPGPTDAAVGDSVSAAPSAVQHSVAGGSTVPAEEEIRRRLQELGASLGGDDDPVFEEEILSDSDISQHFSEEEEEEEAAALLGDSSDGDSSVEEGEEEEGSQDASEAANAQSREQAQPQHAHELATAGPDATAAAHDADRAHTAAAWAMPPPPPRPRPSGIVAAAAPAAQALHQQAPATAASGHQEASVQPASLAAHDSFGFAAIEAEGELGAFGAELGTLEDPIAHRTRAHHSLAQFSIEELEQMLQVDEELEGLALDEEAEYQRFLQSLRGGEGGEDAPLGFLEDDGEDSDDGDFFQELRGMLGMAEAAQEGPGGGGGPRRRRKTTERQPRQRGPRQARWTRSALGERTIESVAALREHRLRPLAPKPFITDIARLATLAAAAASQDDPRPPVAVNTIVGPMLVPAAAVAGPPLPPLPPGVKRDPVVWQPPLPAALRKQLPPETAAVLGQGAAPAPLPVGAPPEEGAEVQLAAFQPKQYRQLYHLVHQHAQLLMQMYVMGASSSNPEHRRVAAQAQRMAAELRSFAERQSSNRQAQGIAPYNPEALGFSDRLPPLPAEDSDDAARRRRRQSRMQRELEARQQLDAAQAAWQPWSSTAVFSVADVAPLRWMQHVVDGVPLPPGDVPQQRQPGVGGGEGAPHQALATRCRGVASTPARQQLTEQEQQQPNAQALRPAGAGNSGLQGGPGSQEEDSSDEDDVREAEARAARRPRRSKKKKYVPLMQHPVWSALPPPAAAVVADVHPLLEPLLVPRAPEHLTSHQMLFCPAEDELLALGLQRYGYDWPRIRAELLPTKSLAQLKNRRKNRCAGNAPDNCIKDVVASISGELLPDEVALLDKALHYYGRQPHRWHIICRDHLPHRQPQILARLWSQHTGGASRLEPNRPSGGARRIDRKRQRSANGPDGSAGEAPEGGPGSEAEAGGSETEAGPAEDAGAPRGSPPPRLQQQRQPRRGRRTPAEAPRPPQRPAMRNVFLRGGPSDAQRQPTVQEVQQQQQSEESEQPPLLLQAGAAPPAPFVAAQREQLQQQQWEAAAEAQGGDAGQGGFAGDDPGAGSRACLTAAAQGQQLQGQQPGAPPVFEVEELADSEDDEQAAPPPADQTPAAVGGGVAAQPSAQGAGPSVGGATSQPCRQQQASVAAGARFDREELSDSDDEGPAPAPDPAEAGGPGVAPGQAAGAGQEEAGGSPHAAASMLQQRLQPGSGQQRGEVLDRQRVQQAAPPAAPLVFGAPVRRSARAAAKRQRQETEPQSAAAGRQGSPQSNKAKQLRLNDASTAAAPAEADGEGRSAADREHLPLQGQQPGAPPVFEVEELADSEDDERAVPPPADQGPGAAAGSDQASAAASDDAPVQTKQPQVRLDVAQPGLQQPLPDAQEAQRVQPAAAGGPGDQQLQRDPLGPLNAEEQVSQQQALPEAQQLHAGQSVLGPAGPDAVELASEGQAPAAAPCFTVAQDKLMLLTLLKAGGRLVAGQLADLVEQLGGGGAGCTPEAVSARCLALLARYQEKQRLKKAAAAAPLRLP